MEIKYFIDCASPCNEWWRWSHHRVKGSSSERIMSERLVFEKAIEKAISKGSSKKISSTFFTVSWEFEVVNVDCISNFYTFYCCWKYCFLQVFQPWFKVSEYPFKQNRSMLKNMTMLLYIYFSNISLNVLRPTFFNICNLPFLWSPNIGKIRVNVGPKTNYFSYFMSSCTNRTAFSIYFFTAM